MAASHIPVPGTTFNVKLIKIGGSRYLNITPEMREYLGIKGDEELCTVKYDLGKHGPFVGFGVAKR